MKTSIDPILQTLLPLREPTFFILLSLAAGEKHGYAILKSVESLSRGKLKMSTGTLYEALARLVDQNLIERVDAAAVRPDSKLTGDLRGRTRKAYRLTHLGKKALSAETARMKDLVAVAMELLRTESNG